jgi:hypothetical protein
MRQLCQLIRTSRRHPVRDMHFVANQRAVMAAFAAAEPHVLLVYVGGPQDDAGLSTIRFICPWKNPNRPRPS